jgi:hypothetical protein
MLLVCRCRKCHGSRSHESRLFGIEKRLDVFQPRHQIVGANREVKSIVAVVVITAIVDVPRRLYRSLEAPPYAQPSHKSLDANCGCGTHPQVSRHRRFTAHRCLRSP